MTRQRRLPLTTFQAAKLASDELAGDDFGW
jgi:hypothetical protein